MKPKISLITLGVGNLTESTKFYSEGLGLPLFDGSNENISFFDLDGTWLSLYPKERLAEDAVQAKIADGFSGFSLAHNVSSKEEVDTILAQAENAGANLVKAAKNTFWGGYSGYFSDLDGFLWEVAWNPHFDLT